MLAWLKKIFALRKPIGPLSDWFFVDFDEKGVTMRASPPGGEAWEQGFAWDRILRICFVAEPAASDGIYVFTHDREASYVIPTEATGGSELWGEILRRQLFDAELAIEAASAESGMFCWPPAE